MHGFPDGSVLHVDVSGLTSMTERLMAHGHRGAERISSPLNAVFEAAVGAISESGGFVATFAGDYFRAVFPGVGPHECLKAAEGVRKLLNHCIPGGLHRLAGPHGYGGPWRTTKEVLQRRCRPRTGS